MNSLRRDLFERRLWPVILVLVIAVAAVPFLLRGRAHAKSQILPPAPAAAAATLVANRASVPRRMSKRVRSQLMRFKALRDPFVSGVTKLTSHPTYVEQSVSTTGGTSTSTTASMVSPTPTSSSDSATASAATDGSSSVSTLASAATNTTTNASQTSTSASATTSTTSTTGTTPASSTDPASDSRWTIYSVTLRLGDGDATATQRTDVARLTPLPSATWPKVMFSGVTAGGLAAVFMLGTGVQARGPALCRPDHARCSALVLAPGRVERLVVTKQDGTTRTLKLEVTKIGRRTTRSSSAALAAYDHVSAAGACELQLADPMSYDGRTGVLNANLTKACRTSEATVAFPGAVD